MSAPRAIALATIALAGCQLQSEGFSHTTAPRPAAPRLHERQLTVGEDGLSEPLSFEVPAGTRAIAIEAVGFDAALYALGSLIGPDGDERVGFPAGSMVQTVLNDASDRVVAPLPFGPYQLPRRGTFAHVYPTSADQSFAPGWWQVRIASNANKPVTVRVRLPPDDGGQRLHVNLFVVSDLDWPLADAFLARTRAIFSAAGVEVVLDETHTVRGSAFNTIEDTVLGSPPGPTSEMAELARLGRTLAVSEALSVFLVDDFTASPSLLGFTLSVPGPATPSSYYFGVFARNGNDPLALGRTVAHELGHFLGLHHVENRGGDGTIYPDPIPDTSASVGNLMDFSDNTAVTAQQSFALSRHPLLQQP